VCLSDRDSCFEKAQEWGTKIPIGVIYREERATYEERLPALRRGPLSRRKLDPMQVEKLLGEFV
jgi:2-oxoglutarate ferredoxin oxidoreductase subunit beta